MENKLPITRLSKFFSEDDFDLHMKMSQEYLHGDLNMKLVLFRVDMNRSDIDDVYGEVGSGQLSYLPPIEFNGIVRIETPRTQSYKVGTLRYLEPGNLTVSVYVNHLEELGVDIRVGDYIGYPDNESRIRYYNVVNDGKINADNKHHHFGYKPSYRTIVCSPVQENEFNGF